MLKNNSIFFQSNFMKISLILSIFLTITNQINSLVDPTDIHSIRKNTLGLSTKQDLIPVKLGISENHPNTRIMAYADVNRDKL